MDADAQDPVMVSRTGPARWLLWVPWVLPGLIVAFVGYVVGMSFWMQRPVQFEERDLYGTWVSEGRMVTQLDFRADGLVTISGDPFPFDSRVPNCPSVGEYPWEFFPGDDPSVSVGATCGQLIYAENGMFTTVLALYAGDPDQPESRIKFTRTSTAPPTSAAE
ncbi:hypothetical protein [Leifsonia sp. P73]|uniref:hypothetical protein n=1 Tax=Leifsonia sp. P73 TaxID=3423959 RepID=UPI003DA27704